MALFVLGAALVQAIIVVAAMTTPVWIGGEINASVPWTPLFVVPIVAAWIGAETVHALRRRRLFDGRVRRPTARLVAGGMSAALGTVPAAFGVALLSGIVDDSIVTGASALLAGAGVVLLMPRHRPGTCVHCEYDLAGTASTRPCPECGVLAGACV